MNEALISGTKYNLQKHVFIILYDEFSLVLVVK